MRATSALGAALVVAALLVGCTEDDADLGGLVPTPTVELSRSGGCGDVFLWAADDAGSVVVTVTAPLSDRSAAGRTIVDVVLPDDAVEVEVLHGDDLTVDLCTDLVEDAHEPTSTSPAIGGRVVLSVDPPGECGETSATVRITGLEAEDGTEFAAIEGDSDHIGCLAG